MVYSYLRCKYCIGRELIKTGKYFIKWIFKTKTLLAKIVQKSLFGQLVNKSSTLTKVCKTHLAVAQIAAKTANNKKQIVKCMPLSAKTAEKKARFLSNLATLTMCFAPSVFKNQKLKKIKLS